MKKRGLGRDLSALLGGASRSDAGRTDSDQAEQSASVETVTPSIQADSTNQGIKQLAVEQLQRGRYQPRSDFSEAALIELANSIKENGIVQPIVVRPLSNENEYEIVAGERRWRAAQLAGLREVPVIIRPLSDKEAIAVALIENIQRQDLNPIEEATAVHRLIEEFALTHQEAADAIGRSRTAVSNLIRLLSLDSQVKDAVSEGKLEMGHARALLGLDITQQYNAATHVIGKGLSVRETEAYVKKLLNPEKKPNTTKEVDPHIAALENLLAEKLGAKVHFQHGPKGKGKMVIDYNSLDELDGILEHIN